LPGGSLQDLRIEVVNLFDSGIDLPRLQQAQRTEGEAGTSRSHHATPRHDIRHGTCQSTGEREETNVTALSWTAFRIKTLSVMASKGTEGSVPEAYGGEREREREEP